MQKGPGQRGNLGRRRPPAHSQREKAGLGAGLPCTASHFKQMMGVISRASDEPSCPFTVHAARREDTRPQWLYGQIVANVPAVCWSFRCPANVPCAFHRHRKSSCEARAGRPRCEQAQESGSRVVTKLDSAQECAVLCRCTIYSWISPHPRIQGEKPYDRPRIGVQDV